jgi:hypothetical protein
MATWHQTQGTLFLDFEKIEQLKAEPKALTTPFSNQPGEKIRTVAINQNAVGHRPTSHYYASAPDASAFIDQDNLLSQLRRCKKCGGLHLRGRCR